MNFALLLQFGFSASLQKLARWCPVRNATHACSTLVTPTGSQLPIAAFAVGPTSLAPHAANPLSTLHRPLRVVRVIEAGQPQSHVGRMVISGCMADVCAELDRLVARETALS